MVETQLTQDLIEEGARLVENLDGTQFAPDAALWFYFPDVGTWKLILAEIKVGAEGPREVYRIVQRSLAELKDSVTHLSLEDVAVAKPDAPIIQVLRRAIATGPGISGIRFSRNVIDGIPIEDAYIYRLRRPAA